MKCWLSKVDIYVLVEQRIASWFVYNSPISEETKRRVAGQARTRFSFNILVATQDKQNSFVGGQTCVKRVSVSLTGSLGYTLALSFTDKYFLFSYDHH